MKSLLQKSMVLALSALLVSETAQAGAPQPLNPRAVGQRKDAVEKALAAYNLAQPDLRALPQIIADAQSIRDAYSQKEWKGLTADFYTKTGVNLEANPAAMVNALRTLIQTLGLNGNTIVDQLARQTLQNAQDFQAAWQAFLALGGNGSLFPNAQQQASGLLGITIADLQRIRSSRGEEVRELQNLVQRIQNDLTGTQFDRDALAKDLKIMQERLATSLRKTDKDRSDSDQDVQTLRNQIKDLQRKLDLKEDVLNIARDKRAEAEQQLAQLQQQLAENQKTIQMRTGERDSLKEMLLRKKTT